MTETMGWIVLDLFWEFLISAVQHGVHTRTRCLVLGARLAWCLAGAFALDWIEALYWSSEFEFWVLFMHGICRGIWELDWSFASTGSLVLWHPYFINSLKNVTFCSDI
jgi:hypothetical protein